MKVNSKEKGSKEQKERPYINIKASIWYLEDPSEDQEHVQFNL